MCFLSIFLLFSFLLSPVKGSTAPNASHVKIAERVAKGAWLTLPLALLFTIIPYALIRKINSAIVKKEEIEGEMNKADMVKFVLKFHKKEVLLFFSVCTLFLLGSKGIQWCNEILESQQHPPLSSGLRDLCLTGLFTGVLAARESKLIKANSANPHLVLWGIASIFFSTLCAGGFLMRNAIFTTENMTIKSV